MSLSPRFKKLDQLVRLAPDLSDARKGRSLTAIAGLERIVRITHLNQSWSPSRDDALREEHLVALEYTGDAIAKIAKFIVPTDAERREFVSKLDEAIEAFSGASDISAGMLVDTLATLKLLLEKLDFFGIDELTEKLIIAGLQLKVVGDDPATRNPNTTAGQAWRKAAVAISLLVNCLVVPHDVAIATSDYYQWGQTSLSWIREQTSTEPRRLTGPQIEPGAQIDAVPVEI